MKTNWKAELILIFATLLAALGWIFSKEALQGMPAFSFIGLRFLLASLCLLPFCYKELRALNKWDILKAMAVGTLLGSSLLLWIHALSVSNALGEGAFIMSLSMLIVPLLAWPLFNKPPENIFWFSIPFAIMGLFLLSADVQWQASSSQSWFILAAIALAFHFNFNGKYAQRIPTLLLTCLQLFVVGVMGLIASLSFETTSPLLESHIWGWFIMSVLFATSLRFVLQTIGQKKCSFSLAPIIMILEPLWVVFLSTLWYQEAMPINKVYGCVLIVFSLLLYRVGGNWFVKKEAV
ncbi:DMT family transporter [Psychromonas hadalis]|uniref:DMT family transporter n=1 Tax=Psychromonas hadalis TaxID=211669 RepID=UPI0003B2E534|nr:DMT family transporter [Psychromonas hadalis]